MVTVRELIAMLQAEDPDAIVMVNLLPADYREGGCWDGERWRFAVDHLEHSDSRVNIDCHPPTESGSSDPQA